MKLTTRQIYYIFLAAVITCILVSCGKHVKPERFDKWRTSDDKPLPPREYEHLYIGDEELEELPEAEEENEDERR